MELCLWMAHVLRQLQETILLKDKLACKQRYQSNKHDRLSDQGRSTLADLGRRSSSSDTMARPTYTFRMLVIGCCSTRAAA